MMMAHKFCCSILFILLTGYACATTVGSDSVPSRQGYVTFQESDSDNEMNGFASFESGFKLQSSNTTCTFDSFFPISDSVDMNGGTLYLSKDLVFDSGVSLTNMGNIYGGGKSVVFPEVVTTFTVYASGSVPGTPSSLSEIDTEALSLWARAVDWSYDDNYLFCACGGKRVIVNSFNGTTIALVTTVDPSTDALAARAHPTAYYFVVGLDTSNPRKELIVYKLVGSDLSSVEELDLDVEINAVDWSPDGGYVATAGLNDTRVFSFSSETLSQEASLSLGANEEASLSAICWDRTGNYYVVGIGHSTSSKVRIYYFNGSSITEKDYVSTGGDYVTAVDWSKTGSWIAAGTNGSSNQLRVYEYDSSSDTLTQKTSIGVGAEVKSVHWDSGAEHLVIGKVLDSGGTELRVYTFDQDTQSLELDQEVELATNVYGIRWSHDDNYVACVDSSDNLIVYEHSPPSPDVNYFSDSVIFDNITFVLSNSMSWKMATTVQGDCIIDAGYNRITLEDTGVITVTSGATLTFDNANLCGFTAENFVCVDDNVSITFRNCTICLDYDLTFDTGSILFEGDVKFTGTNKFIYSSGRTSTIASNAIVLFDFDTTFSYAPSIADRDLIYMMDETSVLCFNGSTLHSTSTGLRLTNGTVYFDNFVTVSSEGSVQAEAICFGNGVATGDVEIECLADVDVITYGEIDYQCIN